MKRDVLLERGFKERFSELEKDYEEKTGLIKEVIKQQKHYHTSINSGVVHRTRENLEYAIALLYRGKKAEKEKAYGIINQVLSLQCLDKTKDTYGIWPYLFEEPLEEMKAPDWNWAGFIGRVLLHVLIDLKNELPDELNDKVVNALLAAGKSIIIRNMGPDYTNITLLNAYVTTKTGELLCNQELFDFGSRSLKKELEFVKKNGGFSEYNSPDYGLIDLEEIGRILKYVNNEEVVSVAKEINNLLWKQLAQHFHYNTGQVCPPHSRCYDNIKERKLLTVIELGCNGHIDILKGRKPEIGLLWPWVSFSCPEEYYKYFKGPQDETLLKEKFYQGYEIIEENQLRVNIEKNMPTLESTSFIAPEFCIGSFKYYDLWSQRRPLMGYFLNEEQCSYFRVRVLHDGQDYASAVISNLQENATIAGGISFVVDHGDYHFILDPFEDSKIKASNLSVCFETGGYIENISIRELEGGRKYAFEIENYTIFLDILYACFSNETISYYIKETEETKSVILNLFELENGEIDFKKVDKATVLYGIQVMRSNQTVDTMFDYEIKEDIAKIFMYNNGVKTNEISDIQIKPSTFIKNSCSCKKIIKKGGYLYK